MAGRISNARTLRDVLVIRGLTMDALAVIGGVDTATISKICAGKARATPRTVVKLARGLGINARRMARLCDQAWRDREQRSTDDQAEMLRNVDIDAMAGAR